MNSKVHVVAGGAGFIGTNLVKELLSRDIFVVVLDNLILGSLDNFKALGIPLERVIFKKVNLASEPETLSVFADLVETYGQVSTVWHLAANSDIQTGSSDFRVDLENTFLTTISLLQACEYVQCKRFFFASSSAVYGDHGGKGLDESLGPLKPISNYGAMKLASEAVICAANEKFLDDAIIFRFPNVVGVPATHGVIYDFVRKLKLNSSQLRVLGDGTQQKSYLHVSELINCMLFIMLESDLQSPLIVNVGNDDLGVRVAEIASTVVEFYGGDTVIEFGESDRGWLGDVPKFSYDISFLKSLGWAPTMSSKEAIARAAAEIVRQETLD